MKPVATYSPKVTEFLAMWAEYFPRPRDWSAEYLGDGTSSLVGWVAWVDQERTSLSVLRDVLRVFADGDRGTAPTLYQARKAYMSRHAPHQFDTGRSVCAECDGHGVVRVVEAYIVRPDSDGRMRCLLTQITEPTACEANVATIPCQCKRRVPDWLWSRRFTDPSTADRLAYQCQAMLSGERRALGAPTMAQTIASILPHEPAPAVVVEDAEVNEREREWA